jgi:hypothetical protein
MKFIISCYLILSYLFIYFGNVCDILELCALLSPSLNILLCICVPRIIYKISLTAAPSNEVPGARRGRSCRRRCFRNPINDHKGRTWSGVWEVDLELYWGSGRLNTNLIGLEWGSGRLNWSGGLN